MSRAQCAKCPWKVSVDPHEIPNGYCEEKHRRLERTIDRDHVPFTRGGLSMMACHETYAGCESACVGWLHNQLGVGNNLALRMACSAGVVDADVEIEGEQHQRFEDTLPDGGAA